MKEKFGTSWSAVNTEFKRLTSIWNYFFESIPTMKNVDKQFKPFKEMQAALLSHGRHGYKVGLLRTEEELHGTGV